MSAQFSDVNISLCGVQFPKTIPNNNNNSNSNTHTHTHTRTCKYNSVHFIDEDYDEKYLFLVNK